MTRNPTRLNPSSTRRARVHSEPVQRGGFTLIEVIGAILLTTMVITAAVTSYVNLSDASTRAAARMRERLHATTVLDRVARDVRAASLVVKPAEMDPLSHPWFFVADGRFSFDGSDRIKLITRSHRPRVTAYHASDLAEVAYFTRTEEDGRLTLLRWASPSLPPAYTADFPAEDDPATWVVAEGLGSFSLRFLQEGGEWTPEWDSTQIVESSQLPYAVEIKLSLRREDADPDEVLAEADIQYFTREVLLPLRPLDLEAMIEAKAEAQLAGAAGGAGFFGGPDGDQDSEGSDVDCSGLLASACSQWPNFFDEQCNPLVPLEAIRSQLPSELQSCIQ